MVVQCAHDELVCVCLHVCYKIHLTDLFSKVVVVQCAHDELLLGLLAGDPVHGLHLVVVWVCACDVRV